ncbi:hypothetical protein BC332_18353 [Capsicum chinense]|nr:hypothetical protein BC332_18353 [Capsicum chinense]
MTRCPKRHSEPSSEIQKLAKILPTYLELSGFLDQKIHTDWSMIETYRDKTDNSWDVEYVEGFTQQSSGSLDCGLFVAAYAEYLSDELYVPNDGLYAQLLYKIYANLLWCYGDMKVENWSISDIKDPRLSKPNSTPQDEEQLVNIE